MPSGLALGFGRSRVGVSYSARGGSGFRVLSLGFRDRDYLAILTGFWCAGILDRLLVNSEDKKGQEVQLSLEAQAPWSCKTTPLSLDQLWLDHRATMT